MIVEERLRPQATDDGDARAGEGHCREVVDAGAERRGALAERVGDELVHRARPAVPLGELAQRPADTEHADRREQDHEWSGSRRKHEGEQAAQHAAGEDRADR